MMNNANTALRSRSQEEGEIGEEEGEISSVPRRPSSFRRHTFSDRLPDRGFRRNCAGISGASVSGGGRGGRNTINGGRIGPGGRCGSNSASWIPVPRRGRGGGRGASFKRSENPPFPHSDSSSFHRNNSVSNNIGDFSVSSNLGSCGLNRPTDPRANNINSAGNSYRRNLGFSRNNNFQNSNNGTSGGLLRSNSTSNNANGNNMNSSNNNSAGRSLSSGVDNSNFRSNNISINSNNGKPTNFGRSFPSSNDDNGPDFSRSTSRSENNFRGDFRSISNRQSDLNFRAVNTARSDAEFRNGEFPNQIRSCDDYRLATNSKQTDNFGRGGFQPIPSQQPRGITSYSSLADPGPNNDFTSTGRGGFRQSTSQGRKPYQFNPSNNNTRKAVPDPSMQARPTLDAANSTSKNPRSPSDVVQVRNSSAEIQNDRRSVSSRSLDQRRNIGESSDHRWSSDILPDRRVESRGYDYQRQGPSRPDQRWDPRFQRPQLHLSQQNESTSSVENIVVEEHGKDSPLTVSILSETYSEKAVATIKIVCEIMNQPSLVSSISGETRLPDKKLMDSAMKKQDILIQKTNENVTKVKSELENIEQQEEVELKRRKEALLMEQKHREEEQKRLENIRRENERLEKEKEIQRKVQECKVTWEKRIEDFEKEVERKKKETLTEMIEKIEDEKDAEKKRFKSETASLLETAGNSYSSNIIKTKRLLQKKLKEAKIVDSEIEQLTSEFRSIMEVNLNAAAQDEIDNRNAISKILLQNRRKAQDAQLESSDFFSEEESGNHDSEEPQDKTLYEWSKSARDVTGRAEAIYTEPCENPYFKQIQNVHLKIEPLVKEYIRDDNRKLKRRWSELAEEYIVRKQLYDKRMRRKGSSRETMTGTSKRGKGRASILGMNNQAVSSPTREGISTPGGRTSNNSCRRPRRGGATTPGDVVRSEYEQEQIIAELTAKEAMEKRIAHGSIRATPQICKLERNLKATYFNTFESQRTLDPVFESKKQALSNIWTDMEKCIFLDRFLQHPKDFRKIASFLRNKTTKDCVAFYYDSKQSVPYKSALKEHLMRRKRRGDYHTWDATIEASLSCGATISAGVSEEKPLLFKLPTHDTTFDTFDLHPIKRKTLDKIDASDNNYDKALLVDNLPSKNRKLKKDPLFILDKKAQKYLRSSVHNSRDRTKDDEFRSKLYMRDKLELEDQRQASSRTSQKWAASEKKIFQEIVNEHGSNWSMLEAALSSKTPSQIKTFFQEYQKHYKRNDVLNNTEDSKIIKIEKEIPRKKTNIVGPLPDNYATDTKAVDTSRIFNKKQQDHHVSREVHEAHETKQQESQIQQIKKTNVADLQQQAMLELAARKVVQNKAKLQKEQQVSNHEAVLLLQHQSRLLEQQAQEEARRIAQLGLSGLSGLSPWTMQMVLQHQQSQQQQQHSHQQSSNQQSESVIFQNTMALGQIPTGHHGFSLDPAVVQRMRIGQLSSLNGGLGNSSLLHVENTSQKEEAERTLAELRGTNVTKAETLNAFRAAARISQGTSPPSIAGAIAYLNHAADKEDKSYPRDQSHHEHQPGDRY